MMARTMVREKLVKALVMENFLSLHDLTKLISDVILLSAVFSLLLGYHEPPAGISVREVCSKRAIRN